MATTTRRRFSTTTALHHVPSKAAARTRTVRKAIAILIPSTLLLLGLLSFFFTDDESSPSTENNLLLTDHPLLYNFSPASKAVTTRSLSLKLLQPSPPSFQSQSTCTLSAVTVITIIREDPPALFFPILNSSICIIAFASSPIPHTHSWRNLTNTFPNSLIIHTSPSLSNLPIHYRSLKIFNLNRTPTSIRNILYLESIRLGARSILDLPDHSAARNIPLLHTLMRNISSSLLTAANLNISSPSNVFVNPLGAFQPIKLSSLSSFSLSPYHRPLGMPPTHYSIPSSDTENNATLSVLVTVVEGYASEIATGATLPVAYTIKEDFVSIPSGRLATFGSDAVLWGAASFGLLYAPSSGCIKSGFSDVLRSIVAQKALQYSSGNVGFGGVLTSKGLEQDWEDIDTDLELTEEEERIAIVSSVSRIGRWVMREWDAFNDGKKKKNAPKNMMQLILQTWNSLHQRGVISSDDVMAAVDYIHDLSSIIDCEESKLCIPVSDSKTSGDSVAVMREESVKEARKPNVAVCVSGQLRSLTLQPNDEEKEHIGWRQVRSSLPTPNTSVAESIQRVLYPRLGGSPDVFMVVSTKEGPHEPQLNDWKACEPLRPPGGKAHLSCNVKREERVPIYKNDTLWKSFAQVKLNKQKWDVVVQGLMQQLKGMYDCHEALQEHTGKTGKKYDYIVRLRPDMYFHKFPSLVTLAADTYMHGGRVAWYANRDTCCCGNEDTFGIGDANVMSHYLDRFVHLQERDWWWQTIIDWSGESFTQLFLEGKGMRLEPHIDIQSCIVKPNRRQSSSEP